MKEEKRCKTKTVGMRKYSLSGNFGMVWFLCQLILFSWFYRLEFDLRRAGWALAIYFLIIYSSCLENRTAH